MLLIAGLLASLGIGADKRAQVDQALATIDAREGDDNRESSLEEQILGKLTAIEHRLDAQDAAINALAVDGQTTDALTTDDDEDGDGETEDRRRKVYPSARWRNGRRKAGDSDMDEDETEDAKRRREEEEEAETMGDTLIEAEGPGMTIQLGKVWTGDSASLQRKGRLAAPSRSLNGLKGMRCCADYFCMAARRSWRSFSAASR